MPGEVVLFGKYKGQPVEVMAADTDYCEWLAAQPWFSAKYRNIYVASRQMPAAGHDASQPGVPCAPFSVMGCR